MAKGPNDGKGLISLREKPNHCPVIIEECQKQAFGGKIIAGSSHPQLAEEISQYLQTPLTLINIQRLSGETWLQVEENVRGTDCFIVQSPHHEVDRLVMELLIISDALRRAAAKAINAVVPLYPYSKQEKKTTGREPITAKLIADLMITAGITRVITIELHAAAIQGFFNIPVDNLYTLEMFANYFYKKGIHGNKVVVISPDAGGVKRAKALADMLDAGLAILFKRRPKHEQVEFFETVGVIRNKIGIIVDDMIMTGGTVVEAGQALKERGVGELFLCTTHPIFSGDALEQIKNSVFKEIVVCNTLPIPNPPAKVKILSVGCLLAQAIYRNWANLSVSGLFRREGMTGDKKKFS